MNNSENEIYLIRENIKMIQLFINIPEIEDIKFKNKEEYREKLKSIFPSFEINYPSLFDIIIFKDDLSPLDFILNTMEKIANGEQDKNKGEMAIGEHLAKKFVKMDLKK